MTESAGTDTARAVAASPAGAAVLNDPVRRDRYRDCVNWALVERYLHLGGVRIEDNIRVTSGAPEVLTSAIPKGLA